MFVLQSNLPHYNIASEMQGKEEKREKGGGGKPVGAEKEAPPTRDPLMGSCYLEPASPSRRVNAASASLELCGGLCAWGRLLWY